MKKETIVVKHLKKSYGSKVVTNDISVTFYGGEIVALVGHNGAGKTTFLNQVNGLVASDEGTILIQGQETTNKSNLARELVSSMPQFQAPLKGVTLKEAISCVGLMKGMKKSDIKVRSKELIAYLEIDKWQETKGEDMSGGLQRLTSFVMSVIDNPSIVVLDEPTNDVDPYRRNLMWRYLRCLTEQGTTVIVVTHNLFEVERYADRYLLIDKGRLKKDVRLVDQEQRELQHQLSVSVLDEAIVDQFLDKSSTRYDEIEKRLTFSVDEEELNTFLPTVLSWLKEDRIISYELKLKNLSDDYEEYING